LANWSLPTHDTVGIDNILILRCSDLSNCFNNHGANFFLFMALCYFLCRALSGLNIQGPLPRALPWATLCIDLSGLLYLATCESLPWKGYTYIAQGSALGWPPAIFKIQSKAFVYPA